MSSLLFSLGSTVTTSSIASLMSSDLSFHTFIYQALARHGRGDWGELCVSDRESNELALKSTGRLFSVYETGPAHVHHGKRIYIITEHDRSVTTVLWPSEY